MRYEVLNKLIEINTIKDKENRKMRKFLTSYLAPYNFTCQEIGTGASKVLIATRGIPKIAFICHTDTVADSTDWTKNPFKVTTDKEYIYGLGVADMKGGIAALLEAISILNINIPCMLCFTYDEEINFTGIKELVTKKITLPDILIFTEPTNLEPVIANKGCIEYKLTFKGKSAHSSTPMLGENAIYQAMAYIKELKEFAENLQTEQNNLFEVPQTTFNLSKVVGGDEINKVPDFCEITFDFRTIKKEHNDQIQQQVKKLAQTYKCEVVLLNNLNAAVNENQEAIKKIEKITKRKALGLNYSTEASFYPEKQIFILGPGPVTAHQKDEKIYRTSYEKCKKLYQQIIETFQ